MLLLLLEHEASGGESMETHSQSQVFLVAEKSLERSAKKQENIFEKVIYPRWQ